MAAPDPWITTHPSLRHLVPPETHSSSRGGDQAGHDLTAPSRRATVMDLRKIFVTQDGLRHRPGAFWKMVQFVADGGFWTEAQHAIYSAARSITHCFQPIELVLTEDGNCYLHDGHHRCAATWLGGRAYLYPDEYRLHRRTYAWYQEVNPDAGYFLAFDPRTQVRNADLRPAQREAHTQFRVSSAAFEAWRTTRADSYRRRRVHRTVPDFASALFDEVTPTSAQAGGDP